MESLSFYRKNFLAISVNTVSVYPTASNAYATSASSFSIVCIILPPNFKVYLCLHRPTFPYLKNTVLSAMKYLTSWFGMVQGVSTSLLTQSKKKSPKNKSQGYTFNKRSSMQLLINNLALFKKLIMEDPILTVLIVIEMTL